MHNQSYVFAQLVSHLDRNKFNYLVRKYQGDSYIKVFSFWDQLKVLMFGQLSRRESLRDLMVAVKAHSGKAKFRKKKGGIRIHTLYDKVIKWKRRMPKNVLSDSIIELTTYKSRIQIYTAIISYCLVAIVLHKMKLETSVNNALQVLGISLTDTTPLADLFNKSNFNIDKELDGFYEPKLFDFYLLNLSTTFSGQQ